jgi:hydrogenase expression/formation protein HypE
MSKFPLAVLEAAVFPFLQTDDPDVILGAAFGEDIALTRVGDDILISHLDPIVGAIGNIGWLAVHVACNDVAASGIPPRWIQLLVLVPTPDDIALLEEIMRDASRATHELGVAIIGGHTGFSAGISRPLVAVTALGVAEGRRVVRTSGARVGDDLWVTKGISLEGTAILAGDFAEVAQRLGLTTVDLEKAKALMNAVSVVPEALVLAQQGATAMHDVTRGGLLETLLEIAHLSGVAVELEVGRLPQVDVVSRFASAFKFDPLRMISSGTLAATAPAAQRQAIADALGEVGVPFARAGGIVGGHGVYVSTDEETTHYTELLPEVDELTRMWELYPRG